MAIDATSIYETGVGNAIRLKRDSNNYVYVGNGAIGFYCSGSGNNENAVASVYGASSNVYCAFQTKGGTLVLENGHLYVNSVEMSNVNHTHSAYSLTSHTHSNYASSSHSHSGYASSSHSHSDETIRPYQVKPTSKGSGYCGNHNDYYWYVVASTYVRYNSVAGSVSSLSLSKNEGNPAREFFKNYSDITLSKANPISAFDSEGSEPTLAEQVYDQIYEMNNEGMVFTDAGCMANYQSQCLELLVNENDDMYEKINNLETQLLEVLNKNKELMTRIEELENKLNNQ